MALPTREARRAALLAQADLGREEGDRLTPATLRWIALARSRTVTCPGCGSLAWEVQVEDGKCPGCALTHYLLAHEGALYEMTETYAVPASARVEP